MKHEGWLWGLLALGLSGCAPLEVYAPESTPEYMTVKATPFYLHGPKQPGLPDDLAPQTFVRLQRKEYGFSIVQLVDGRSGYVATEDIRQAPPAARPVAGEELFPEQFRDIAVTMPEPDLSMPVAEVPVKEKPSEARARQ